jgi:glutamate synthase (NADH)
MGDISLSNHIIPNPVALIDPTNAPSIQEELELEEPYSVYQYNETPDNKSWAGAMPVKQGLYDPAGEKDSCGVGFVA